MNQGTLLEVQKCVMGITGAKVSVENWIFSKEKKWTVKFHRCSLICGITKCKRNNHMKSQQFIIFLIKGAVCLLRENGRSDSVAYV